MIITYTDTVENKYGKYFLASEAPGDEPTEASDEGIIKKNMKISVDKSGTAGYNNTRRR